MSTPASAASVAPGPELRDIHLPPAPAWWPPAPGWWALAVLLLVALGISVWLWRRRRRQRADEHVVLLELDALMQRWRDQPAKLAADLHQLLRRVALRYDASAGQRQGVAWRETLAQVPVTTATLDQLMTIEQAMYRPDVVLDVDAVVTATREWLRAAWRHAKAGASASSPRARQEPGRA
jgi:hypothetical protein